MWTEAWTGWWIVFSIFFSYIVILFNVHSPLFNHCLESMIRFTEFGGPIYQRPVEDLAFSVAKFIQNGGSFVNYYMVCFDGSLFLKIFIL